MSTAILATALMIPLLASAQETKVWATRSDFESGQLVNLDAATSPGHLLLAKRTINWSRYAGNPLLGPHPASWDSDWVAAPNVLYDGSVFRMWYQGCRGTVCDIGYATSSDGLGWAPYSGNPVLTADPLSWDTTLGNPHVLYDGGVYRMWYAGNGPLAIRIGYATSPDGVSWTRAAPWPVFNGTMAWDLAAVSTPAVVQVGSNFLLYFSGHSGTYSYSMGLATSTDGMHWTEDPGNPLLTPHLPWESYRVHPSGVIADASGFKLYYTGASGVGGEHDTAIGYATSFDGRTWTEDPSNPILTWGPPGGWDGSKVAHPSPVLVGTETRMYYTGYNFSLLQIGLATQVPGQIVYVPSGVWMSAVVDSADANTTWESLSWEAVTSIDTAIGATVWVGNTSLPDGSWSYPSPIAFTSPAALDLPRARYAQVILGMATMNESASPDLTRLTLTFSRSAAPPPGPTEVLVLGIPLIVLLLLIPPIVLGILLAALILRRAPTPIAPHSAPPTTPPASCPQCGAARSHENRFCPNCGASFAELDAGRPPPS